MRHKVLVTSPNLVEPALEILVEAGAEILFMRVPVSEADLIAQFSANDIDAVLLHGNPPFGDAVLKSAGKLKIIAKRGAGVDSVDLNAATKRGVAVMIAPGGNTHAVAEHALALMLALVRELPRFDRNLRKGVWRDPRYITKSFRGMSVGILGYGAIGRQVARLTAACGARVVVHTRSRLPESNDYVVEDNLDPFLSRIDVLSLHCPLTEQTKGLIGGAQLALMKPGAFLVNTARGGLIDETALVESLRSGRLAGAGLDTFAVEPPGADNRLLSLENVICTPHVAATTEDAVIEVCTTAARNIVNYLRDGSCNLQNVVNADVIKVGKPTM